MLKKPENVTKNINDVLKERLWYIHFAPQNLIKYICN